MRGIVKASLVTLISLVGCTGSPHNQEKEALDIRTKVQVGMTSQEAMQILRNEGYDVDLIDPKVIYGNKQTGHFIISTGINAFVSLDADGKVVSIRVEPYRIPL